jgi:hypothetical protein
MTNLSDGELVKVGLVVMALLHSRMFGGPDDAAE